MKKTNLKYSVSILIAVFVILLLERSCKGEVESSEFLFTPKEDYKFNEFANQKLNNVENLQVINFNKENLKLNSTIKASFFGEVIEIVINNYDSISDIESAWSGNLSSSNSMLEIYNYNDVFTGSIIYKGRNYEIKKIEEDYILFEVMNDNSIDLEPLFEIKSKKKVK